MTVVVDSPNCSSSWCRSILRRYILRKQQSSVKEAVTDWQAGIALMLLVSVFAMIIEESVVGTQLSFIDNPLSAVICEFLTLYCGCFS